MKLRIPILIGLWFVTLSVLAQAAPDSTTVEVRVRTLALDPNTETPIVILETVTDKRALPIWIDVPEARSIAIELEGVKLPRPLTHDLMRDILRGLNVSVQRVTITELRNNTYFAVLSLSASGQDLQIDARPSDAIAIAMRMKAPIFASVQVLEKSKPLPGQPTRAEQTQKKLGIHVQDLTPELASLMNTSQSTGVLVTDAITHGSAAKAGLQRGDIITKVNQRTVQSVAELESTLKDSAPLTKTIKLELVRGGKPIAVVVDQLK